MKLISESCIRFIKVIFVVDKNSKDVSRTLSEQQTKIAANTDKCDALNVKIDTEIKNVTEKENLKEDKFDEKHLNSRMERLGKEMALLKSKQTDQTQQYDNFSLRQTSMEQQTSNILKTLEKQQKEVQKVKTCENNLQNLEEKVKKNMSKQDQFSCDLNTKADKTEVEEVKVGLDKDKSKITYFQDKISNISKSVDGIKIEINNMRDKFCADIENHDESLKSFSKTLAEQNKILSENSEALKGITKESFGKLKEMVNNCMQVESNIRSIRDKSILFDNDIKQIKDQLLHIKRDKSKSRPPSSEAEVFKQLKIKDEELKSLTECLTGLKKKMQVLQSEVSNIKEDKRTKDVEAEERQASLEQNLSDVRDWVETMLSESNKQLGDIAVEVEAANLKISKCASDLSEVFVQHATNTGDMSFVKKNLEDKISEVKEYGSIQQRELLDKILDLRGSFVDNQTEFVEKVKLTNESISSLREDLNSKIDKLDSSMNQKLETKSKPSSESADLVKKMENIKTDISNLRSEASKLVVENRDKFSKLSCEVAAVKVSAESNSNSYKKLADNITKIENDSVVKGKETKDLLERNKAEIENLTNEHSSLKNKFETCMSDHEKKMGSNETKIQSIDKLESKLKLLEETFNNKMQSVESNFEDTLKNKRIASDNDDDSKISTIRKEIEQVKRELKNADLESFKNVVNNTTETHNKLISGLQKNVDLIICEKTIQESQTAVMDSKIADIVNEREVNDIKTKEKLTEFEKKNDEVNEIINDFKWKMSEISSKTDHFDKLSNSVDSIKSEISFFNKAVTEARESISETKEKLSNELKALKDTSASNTTEYMKQQKNEIKDWEATF